MTAAVVEARVQPADRLLLTVCLAIIIHTMVVLGVSFAPEPHQSAQPETLEVILVTQKSEKAPADAELLAQANLEGGGESDTNVRPTAPMVAPLPAQTAEVAAAAMQPPAPATPAPPNPPLEPTPFKPVDTANSSAKTQTATLAPKPRMTQHKAQAQLPAARPAPETPPPTATPAPTTKTETAPQTAAQAPALPTAAQLITRSFALASLNAELEQKLENRAKRPRLKFISANTQESLYASYMEAWRAKVERIGNLNYPDEARQRELSGSLLLDVALKPDGSVLEIVVRKSSGHKVLDDAAVRIVELAAPFSRFPDDIRKEVDILHITRTWRFLNSNQFSSGGD